MSIEIRNLNKRFGNTVVCDNLNLDIPSGELVALLGPSGSGKTSLLRIIAGLERPDSGSVLFHGEDATFDDVRDRHVGFVFQHYALFGHMSIFENVAFGLRVRPSRAKPDSRVATRPPEAQIKAKVMELLKLVQLDWLADRYPHQLSGGQRQRIALARALAVEPKVLLLDEPFGALDALTRAHLQQELHRIWQAEGITMILVTHDVEEAIYLGDKVVVMEPRPGRIRRIVPVELAHPRDRVALPFARLKEDVLAEFAGEAEAATAARHAGRRGDGTRGPDSGFALPNGLRFAL